MYLAFIYYAISLISAKFLKLFSSFKLAIYKKVKIFLRLLLLMYLLSLTLVE